MSATTPEGKLKLICREWLRFAGAYVFSPVQMGYGAATIDDLVCIRGLFVGIEYKASTNSRVPKPTKRQETVLEAINKAGGLALVIYDLPSLQHELRHVLRS